MDKIARRMKRVAWTWKTHALEISTANKLPGIITIASMRKANIPIFPLNMPY
jgi:hypothetical protein